jgi:hypothetical protein
MRRRLLATFLLFVWVSPIAAQESYRDFEKGLNLSDSQKVRADGIKRKYEDEWRGLEEESLRKRLELRELNQNRPDEREKAVKTRRELDQIENSRQRLMRQYNGEVSAVFNQDQKAKYERFRDREVKRPMAPPGRRPHER